MFSAKENEGAKKKNVFSNLFRTLVSLEDARKALEPFYRRSAEILPLSECYDRVLAEDVYSKTGLDSKTLVTILKKLDSRGYIKITATDKRYQP